MTAIGRGEDKGYQLYKSNTVMRKVLSLIWPYLRYIGLRDNLSNRLDSGRAGELLISDSAASGS